MQPHPEHQWGSATIGPWEEWTTDADRPPTVTSRGPRAGVLLQTLEPRDRRLEVELSAAESTPKGVSVQLLVNDGVAGTFELPTNLQTLEVEAPAVLWLPGKNRFEVACLVDGEPAPEDVKFLMGRVAYGAGARVLTDPLAETIEMQPGTSVEYLICAGSGDRIGLAGRWSGEARLNLRVAPNDSASDAAGPAWEMWEDFDSDAALGTELPLPEGLEGELLLSLALEGSEGASVKLERLEIMDADTRDRPPVILIVIDTLSARNMSLYGYSRPTTPVLDELAESSVVFETTYANSSWTLPSFQSMLTGLYPRSHKPDTSAIVGRRAELWEQHQLSRQRTTLAESFRAGGWSTFAHFDNPWLTETFGIQQGYDKFSSKASEILPPDRTGGIELVTQDFLDWLDAGAAERPFFATLHSFDVHAPYAPPAKWVEKVAAFPSSIQVPDRVLGGGLVFARGAVPNYVDGKVDEHERVSARRLLDLYDGGIAEVDHKLGILFDALRERELFDEALIVVTADHGETMVDGDSFFNHGVSDAPSIHIPLLIKLPGGESGGRRIATPVQLVDLVPTLLDLTDIDADPDRFHGRSLAPALRGEDLEQVPVLTTEGILDHAAVRVGDYRLVVHDLRSGHPAARMTIPGLESDWMKKHLPELVGRPLTKQRYDEIVAKFGGEQQLKLWLAERLPVNSFELYRSSQDLYELNDLWPAATDMHAPLLAALAAELKRADDDRVEQEIDAEVQGMSDLQIDALRAAGYIED